MTSLRLNTQALYLGISLEKEPTHRIHEYEAETLSNTQRKKNNDDDDVILFVPRIHLSLYFLLTLFGGWPRGFSSVSWVRAVLFNFCPRHMLRDRHASSSSSSSP